MTGDLTRLRTTMEQLDRLMGALDDLRENILPKDPRLFTILAEGPLDDLRRLRREVREHVVELQAAGVSL